MSARPQPLESADDRQAYLEAFGVPASCEAGKLTVIYDEPNVEALFDDNQVNSSAPQISGPSKTFNDRRLKKDARVTVDTPDAGPMDFIVREARPDRSGWSTLILDHA